MLGCALVWKVFLVILADLDPIPPTAVAPSYENEPVIKTFPVRVGAPSAIRISDSSFTVMAWVFSAADAKDDEVQTVLAAIDAKAKNTSLHLQVRDGKYVVAYDGSDCKSSGARKKGVWQRVAVVYNKAKQTQSVIVDGVVLGQCTSKKPFGGTGEVFIGQGFEPATRWKGEIKQVEIYTHALSLAMINKKMSSGKYMTITHARIQCLCDWSRL